MSWTHNEARRVLERCERMGKSIAVFQCGFGPSGLPHIGTVAELVRTYMIQQVFSDISNLDSKLILFADDLDALRKVPDTVPEDQKALMESFIGMPVSTIPDPWGEAASFSEHNIGKLIELLMLCGLEKGKHYELLCASNMYSSGAFNKVLCEVGLHAHAITYVVTEHYGPERKASYCPFLPIIDGRTEFNLYDWHISVDVINYQDEEGVVKTHSIVNGNAKLQWKVDWPMRWLALDVDYEMHGKDLIGSAKVGDDICRLMGYEPPLHMMAELFVDEEGKKISKSKGNGLEADEWLSYAPIWSLWYFLHQDPRKSRKLHWGVIPQWVEEYQKNFDVQDNENAMWHIRLHAETQNVIPFGEIDVSYSMLLNLASITDTDDINVFKRYLANYYDKKTVDSPVLQPMIRGAINYYEQFIKDGKIYRSPNEEEKAVLQDILRMLNELDIHDTDNLRSNIFSIGKAHYGKKNLRLFFQMLYEVIMGQQQGPQFHQIIQILGVSKMKEIISNRI